MFTHKSFSFTISVRWIPARGYIHILWNARLYFTDDFNSNCSIVSQKWNETKRNANQVHGLLRRTNGCTFVILPEIRRPLLHQMLRVHFRHGCMRVNWERSERLCQAKVQQTGFHKIMTSIGEWKGEWGGKKRREKVGTLAGERNITS